MKRSIHFIILSTFILMITLAFYSFLKSFLDQKTMEHEEDLFLRADRIYQLANAIVDLKQSNFTIEVYYYKLKGPWDEMDEIKAPYACTCKCVCNNGKENGEREQRKRQVQFSMGLDECYTNIRGQILLMQPLPTVAKAYNMLRQEEKQRDTHKQQVNSPIALNTYKTPFTTSYNPSQRFNTPNLNTPSANSEPERRGTFRKGVIYAYCKKEGHLKEECYKLLCYLVGHPLHKYFPPSQRTQGNIKIVNIVTGESSNNVGNVDRGSPWSSPLEPISVPNETHVYARMD
ncbi:hypothetical protein Tco_1358876 [Tanacetum coccineum]